MHALETLVRISKDLFSQQVSLFLPDIATMKVEACPLETSSLSVILLTFCDNVNVGTARRLLT